MIATIISTLTFFALYAILALSLNLEYGNAGLPNFGKVAFQAIGSMVAGSFVAYTILFVRGLSLDIISPEAVAARVEMAQTSPALYAIIFLFSLILSGAAGALFGFLSSYPALRTSGDYLALVLLVFAESLRLVARNIRPFVGATYGLPAIPNPFAWIQDVDTQYLCFGIVVFGFFSAVYVLCEKLTNSPYGRLLRAVRENEIASQHLGKEIQRIKAQVLTISSAIAGLGGALYTYYLSSVQADDFGATKTFDIWLMVIIGGTGNNKGVLLGVLLITVADRLTRFFGGAIRATTLIEINYVRYIAMGIIMLIMLARRSSGLIPERSVRTPALEVLSRSEDS